MARKNNDVNFRIPRNIHKKLRSKRNNINKLTGKRITLTKTMDIALDQPIFVDRPEVRRRLRRRRDEF